MFQDVAGIERKRQRDAHVQERHQQEEHDQPQGIEPLQQRRALQPGVQRPGENDRRKGQEEQVEHFVGQGAGQRIAAVLLGLGQLLGRHAGL